MASSPSYPNSSLGSSAQTLSEGSVPLYSPAVRRSAQGCGRHLAAGLAVRSGSQLAVVSDLNAVSEDWSVPRQTKRLQTLLRKAHRRGDLRLEATCLIRLGDLALREGDSEEAGDLYRRALQLSRLLIEQRQALSQR